MRSNANEMPIRLEAAVLTVLTVLTVLLQKKCNKQHNNELRSCCLGSRGLGCSLYSSLMRHTQCCQLVCLLDTSSNQHTGAQCPGRPTVPLPSRLPESSHWLSSFHALENTVNKSLFQDPCSHLNIAHRYVEIQYLDPDLKS